MMRKTILLALLGVFSCSRLLAQAWDGITLAQPALSGTTYTITSPAELAWVAVQDNSFAGYKFVLTQSIDLGGQNQIYWKPIGSADKPFEGDFDGSCYTIANMAISNISGRQTDYGLFGVIGANGRVHNLAIESGNIFFDQKTYVGAIAGRNNGTIDHCFSLIRIFVDQTDNVGGIVGENNGIIDHCFQGGYIEFAHDNVGGIAGRNTGVISNSYVSGFTYGTSAGAVIGANAGGTYTNVFFDQQMGPQHPSKDGLVQGITLVTYTYDMFGIFKDDPDWLTDEDNLYPQLACFAEQSPDASLVAVSPVFMTSNDGSIQRAESTTKAFVLSTLGGVSWANGGEQTSLGVDIVKVMGMGTVLSRPCSTTDVKMTATLNGHTRTVLIKVQGYDPLNPGMIGNRAKACKGDIIKFSDKEKGGEVRDASGGRDDDKKLFPYHYKFEKYVLRDLDGDGVLEDTTLVGTQYVNTPDYKDFLIFADENGHYMYKRYVHDSQCQLEFVQSGGQYFLTVFDTFDPGEIDSEETVIFGAIPSDITIESVRDAGGGEGPYHYEWYLTQKTVDYTTGDETVVQDSVWWQLESLEEQEYPERVLTVEEPGLYYVYRSASDDYCSRKEQHPSEGAKVIRVYEAFTAGIVKDDVINSCSTDVKGIIASLEDAQGGDGRIQYRWLCNGQVISGASESTLNLASLTFDHDRTYRFQRQAKEGSGYTDWTPAVNTYTVIVYKAIDAGRIAPVQQAHQCLAADAKSFSVDLKSSTPATGEGGIQYQWVAYRRANNGTDTKIRDISSNTAALTYDLPLSGLNFPVTIVFKRQAQSTVCQEGWATSDGEAVFSLGRDKNQNKDVYVCTDELPFVYTYKYSDGHTENITFNATGDKRTVNDKQSDGCALNVTLTCKHYPAPKVDVQPLGNMCEGETQLVINYQVKDGNPDTYSITFNDAALAAGFQNETGTVTGQPIVLAIPQSAGFGAYQVLAEFYEAESIGGCAPLKVSLDFNLAAQGFVYQKWGDVLFVDNNPDNHEQGDGDMRFTAFQWFKNGELIPGATGQMYYDPYLQGDLDAVYTVQLTGVDGITYYTCDFRPTAFTALNDPDGFSLHPVPVAAGQHFTLTTPLTGTAAVIDVAGRTLITIALNGTQRYTLQAPSASGTYIVRIADKAGKAAFAKLIVK